MQSRDDWEDDFQEAYAKLAYKHQLPETIPPGVMEWAQSEPLKVKDAATVAVMTASVMSHLYRKPKSFKKKTAQDGYRELVEDTNKAFAEAELLVPKYVVDTIRKEGYMLLYNPGKSLEVTSRFSKVGVKLKLKWPKESLRKRAARAHKAIHLETRQELTLLRQWLPLDIVQAIEAVEAIKAKAPGTGPYVCRKDKATGEWTRLPRE